MIDRPTGDEMTEFRREARTVTLSGAINISLTLWLAMNPGYLAACAVVTQVSII